MTLKRTLAFCILSIFIAFNSASANQDWALIGIDGGAIDKSTVSQPEVDNAGLEVGLKGLLTRYQNKWIYDLGLGYRVDDMSSNDNVSVKTKAFFSELSARYRLNERWSVGPELSGLFGTDVSFSDEGTNSEDKNVALFAGARAMFDTRLNSNKNMLRLGVRANTDLNVSDRQIVQVLAVAEFGWPFALGKTVAKKETPQEEPMQVNLMDAGVRFKTGSAKLIGVSETTINKIATILDLYKDEWASVTVQGHTDIRGPDSLNEKLAKNRAKSVKEVLLDFGIASDKVVAEGFGPHIPLDPSKNEKAYSKNRRVELKIEGLNPSPEFADHLRKVVVQ